MSSWVTKIKKEFSITMGDGAVYKPSYFNANRSTEYNFAEYDFRNLDGTFVDRRRKRGTVYNLDLRFQGDNCIDIATEFQLSANNVKPWIIKHNLYGTLIVQPISPVYHDNGNKILNTTRITVTVRETISATEITNTTSAVDVIIAKQATVNRQYNTALTGALPVPSIAAVQNMSTSLSGFQQALAKAVDTASLIVNGYNAALADITSIYTNINNAVNFVSSAISSVQHFLNLPALLEESIFNKMNYITGEIASLYKQATKLSIAPIPSFEKQWQELKNTWCAFSGSGISSLCAVSVNNIQATDYAYSYQVAASIVQIISVYNQYLASLDAMQTANGGEPTSFIPDPESMIALDDLVNYTVDTLYVLQANAKQPRVVTLTKDNNVIMIARELYGLLPDDSTIDRIIADNNICNSEIFQVKKGRQILYYV